MDEQAIQITPQAYDRALNAVAAELAQTKARLAIVEALLIERAQSPQQ